MKSFTSGDIQINSDEESDKEDSHSITSPSFLSSSLPKSYSKGEYMGRATSSLCSSTDSGFDSQSISSTESDAVYKSSYMKVCSPQNLS